MSEFSGDKLKAGLQAWAEKNQISINQFRKYMDYTYAYSWDLLRGKAIFSAEAFGRFVLAYGMQAGQELMVLAGYPDALPRLEECQEVPVVYVGVEGKNE
jgi:hypothetical protein